MTFLLKRTNALYLLFLTVFLSLTCCSRDKVINTSPPPKIKYLSHIFLNGRLYTQYFYSASYLVDSVNYYDTTGLISSHTAYHYTNTRPTSSDGISYSYFNSSLIATFHKRSIFQYNSNQFISKMAIYHDSSDTADLIVSLEYNSSNKISRILTYNGKDTLLSYMVPRFNGDMLSQFDYYSPKDSLCGSSYVTWDDKINPNLYIRTEDIFMGSPPLHNITSITSPNIDSSGYFIVKIGETSISNPVFNSSFTYDADSYPITENRVLLSTPQTTQIFTYGYLQ